MVTPEPDPTVGAVVARVRDRLPSTRTGADRRTADLLIDALAPEFWSLQHHLGAVRRDIVGVDDKVISLAGRVWRVEERTGRLEDKVGRLEERVGRLEDKVDRLEERVGRLEDKVDRLDERVGRVEDKVDRLDERVGRVEDKVDQLASAVGELRQDNVVMRQQIAGMSEMMSEILRRLPE